MIHRMLGSTKPVLLMMSIALVLASCSLFKPAFKGKVLDPVKRAPEISMTDDDGRPFQLSALRGKIVLLVFGYTNCPDECPLTMANLRQTLELLGEEAQNVQVVMVSTDPYRDTPQAMNDFLERFDSTFLGITGVPEDLARIWADYGIEVQFAGLVHSSVTYVVDTQGDLRLAIDANTSPETIASDLKLLLTDY
jgi:protein SCO1/2